MGRRTGGVSPSKSPARDGVPGPREAGVNERLRDQTVPGVGLPAGRSVHSCLVDEAAKPSDA